MSRRLFTTVHKLKLLNEYRQVSKTYGMKTLRQPAAFVFPLNRQETAIPLSRFLSNGLNHSLNSQSPICSLVKFKDGFLRFNVDNQNFVVSFWTPVNQIAEVIRPLASTAKVAAGQEVDTNMLAAPQTTTQIFDMNQEEVVDCVKPTPLGTVLSDSGTVVVSTTGDGSKAVQLKLDGVVDDIKKWMLTNNPPKPFEAQVRFTDSNLNSIQYFNPTHNLSFNSERMSHPNCTNLTNTEVLHVILF